MSTNAPFLVLPATRRLLAIAGGLYDILADGDRTGGHYALVSLFQPVDTGTPSHTHSREDEAFYILSGEMTFVVGGRTQVVPAGAFVHAPRDIERYFRATSSDGVRALVWITPAGLENFFREVGEPLTSDTMVPPPVSDAHVQRLLQVAPQYGLRIRL